ARRGRRVRSGAGPVAAPGSAARRGGAAGNGGRRARGRAACLLGGDAAAAGARGSARVTDLLWRSGTWEQVTPESAGWSHLFFGVRTGSFSAATGGAEVALVPLSGRCRVESGGDSWEFGGRENVFAGLPWALYLPRGSDYRVEAEGEVAI